MRKGSGRTWWKVLKAKFYKFRALRAERHRDYAKAEKLAERARKAGAI